VLDSGHAGRRPAEPALVGVDPLIQKLKLKIRRVDDDILNAVRAQSTSGSQAKADLEAAMHAIQARPRSAAGCAACGCARRRG
jgi:hypothetical protein